MQHLDPIRQRVRSARLDAPPVDWQPVVTMAVGGLTEVGFDNTGSYLLVVSSTGRGLVDTRTGSPVARDRAEPSDDWYNEFRLEAKGIGPIATETVRLSGLHGGALPRHTRTGWSIEPVMLDWPVVHLLLFRQWTSIFQGAEFSKIALESELRAFGFSHDGLTLLLATSSELRVWRTG
jgi:hypothetical protein